MDSLSPSKTHTEADNRVKESPVHVSATPNYTGNMTPAAAEVPHVVLVPFPTQGHINPFSSLAHYLAASGISVTVVYSARTHSLLSSSSPPIAGLAPGCSARPDNLLHTPIRIEIMPDDTTAGDRLSFSTIKASFPVMSKGLDDILQKLMHESNPPSCMITDTLLPWCHDVSTNCGLPRVEVWTASASILSVGFHVPELIERGYIPAVDRESQEKTIDFLPGLSPFRIADMPETMRAAEGLHSPTFEFFCSVFAHMKSADRLLVNTLYELESEVVDALRTKDGLHVDTVGPLFLLSSLMSPSIAHSSLLHEDISCLTWLDHQEASSVLYISFGSIATIAGDVFEELAHGLEASGERFLWVIRPDAHTDKINTTAEELLPEGFIERMKGRGLVITWAPQLAVLAHPSVSAFLTHCGWNSVMESLSNGIPMLGFPQRAEQKTNLKFIVQDWKVGMPLLGKDVCKTECGCVQQAVSAIMKGSGAEVRRRAQEWRGIAHKAAELHGTSNSNLQKLVDDLRGGHFSSKPLSHVDSEGN